jgi:DNA-binding FrmR family transcriptional regulator
MSTPSANMRDVFWDVEDMMRRLRRIEGQVRGVEAMVLRAESCQSVLTQVAAIEGAIKQVARIISACSVAERVVQLSDSPVDVSEVRAAIKEVLRAGS